MSTSEVSAAHSRVANTARRYGSGSPEHRASQRDLNAAVLKARAREIVAKGNRLTDAQVEDVVRILRRPASLIASADSGTADS